MPPLIREDGKEDEELYGYYQKAKSKREPSVRKTNYLIVARGQVLDKGVQCGYVVDVMFGPDISQPEIYISQESLDSDSKLRKCVVGSCGTHRVVHTLTAVEACKIIMDELEKLAEVNVCTYHLAPSAGFIYTPNGQVSFVSQQETLILQAPPVGKAIKFIFSDSLAKALSIPMPVFTTFPDQRGLHSVDFQQFVEDMVICFGTEGLYDVAKCVEACAYGPLLAQDVHLTSLVFYGLRGSGKTARQTVMQSMFCLPPSSIMAGSTTTSALTSDLTAYSGLLRFYSDPRKASVACDEDLVWLTTTH
jgi:hypothetical protein